MLHDNAQTLNKNILRVCLDGEEDSRIAFFISHCLEWYCLANVARVWTGYLNSYVDKNSPAKCR